MTSNHTPEDCKSVFVTWVWMIGILLGMACSVGGLCWAASAIVSDNVAEHATYKQRLEGVERNGAKLDTIIYILRQR